MVDHRNVGGPTGTGPASSAHLETGAGPASSPHVESGPASSPTTGSGPAAAPGAEPGPAASPPAGPGPASSPQGGIGPPASPPSGFRHGVRAFRHRNYKLFFFGAMASNSGNWLQNLAVPFVLFELTERSLYVGLAGFAQFIPSFLLGPLGGNLADRLDRRRVLLGTQSMMALAAFLLWAVWAVGWRNPWLILSITALTGIFSGLMIPSWQAFVPSLVPKSDLASAITLNSTQFNAARALGPALAGVLLATAGPGWAFFLNGVSFLAVIGAIWVVRPLPVERPAGPRPGSEGVVAGFTDAISYIRDRTGIRLGIMTTMLVAFFGNPVTQFTVVFTGQVYNAGPRVLGVLASSVGVGAVLIAPIMSTWDGRIPRSVVIRWALPAYAMAVIAFGAAPSWPLGLAALLLVGAGFLSVVATTNTSVQLIVADHMRGRVMSVRVMGFTLSFPLGSLLQGVMADLIGPQLTVMASGLILLTAAIYLSSKPSMLSNLDREDDTADRASPTG